MTYHDNSNNNNKNPGHPDSGKYISTLMKWQLEWCFSEHHISKIIDKVLLTGKNNSGNSLSLEEGGNTDLEWWKQKWQVWFEAKV